MRIQQKNKQQMFYALPLGEVDVYERDDDGNIIYIEVDGEQVPVPTGDKEQGYGIVTEFNACISGKLNESRAQVYGVSQDSIYSEIVTEKHTLPFIVGTKVWKNTVPEIDDLGYAKNPNGADYTVKGILDEFLDFDWYLLERITK